MFVHVKREDSGTFSVLLMCGAIFMFCSSLFFCTCDLKVPDWLPSRLVSPVYPKNRKNNERQQNWPVSESSILGWPTLEEYSPKHKVEDHSLGIQYSPSVFIAEKAIPCHAIMEPLQCFGIQAIVTHSLCEGKLECLFLFHPYLSKFHPWRLGSNASFSTKPFLSPCECGFPSAFHSTFF